MRQYALYLDGERVEGVVGSLFDVLSEACSRAGMMTVEQFIRLGFTVKGL